MIIKPFIRFAENNHERVSCQSTAKVPDFTATGITASSEVGTSAEAFNAALATVQDVEALAISGCVAASVSGRKICFTVPILCRFCYPSPVPIPIGAQLKACFQTYGTIIPTGVKVTVHLNGKAIFTKVIGRC